MRRSTQGGSKCHRADKREGGKVKVIVCVCVCTIGLLLLFATHKHTSSRSKGTSNYFCVVFVCSQCMTQIAKLKGGGE